MVGSSSPNGNPLSAGSLATFMATSLPRDATPQIKNATEAIALAVHAGFLAVGFRLVGLGEEDTIEAHSDAEQPQALPTAWNASSVYAFRYSHPQSAMQYLVKVHRMGSKIIIMGMGIGDDKPTSFDTTANEYISGSSVPATPLPEGTELEAALDPIQKIFISDGRLSDLGSELRVRLIQKLMPSMQKEGYEEDVSTTAETQRTGPPDPSNPSTDDRRAPRPEPPLHDPLALPPRNRPVPVGDFPPPDFEDEHQILRPPLRGGVQPPGLGGYGDSDLYPAGLGPRDPMYPSGIGPRLGPGHGGGGMHPTFDDPLFGGPGGQGGGFGDLRAPPGARYDPVNPGEGPPQDPLRRGGGMGGFPGRGPGGFGGAGGRPPNPFGGFGSGDFI